GYEPSSRSGAAPPHLHPGASAAIAAGERMIGALGELHPQVATRFGLDVACAVFELDLGGLLGAQPPPPRYRPGSRFPLLRRSPATSRSWSPQAGPPARSRRRSRRVAARTCSRSSSSTATRAAACRRAA